MNKKWISFEGGEGSGKTTLIKALEKRFKEAGQSVLTTREPGGVPVAEKIRHILLDRTKDHMDPMTEAILFAASRRQHLVEKVLPALEEGKIVLMDRYVDSSVVYQGYARGLGMERIAKLNEYATSGMMPSLTFYLDLDPEVGMKRIQTNKRDQNRLDLESMDFHHKIRQGYQLLCEGEERIHCVDANQSMEALLEEVWKVIQEKLG